MPRDRAKKYDYVKRNFAQAVTGPIKSGAGDLLKGVLELFPKADSKRIDGWIWSLAKWPQVEPEAVLFVTLVCGTRFGIYQPEVSEILRELWEWLTWNPRNMKPELADLVVDALAPQLQRELRARKGWRVGPSGDREKKPGRPPTSRPAWVAAAAIDTHLRAKGVGALDATDRALELAAILTGREMAAPEELRHAHMGSPSPAELSKVLTAEFEWWVAHDAVMSNKPGPSSGPQPDPLASRATHRSLPNVLARYGARSLAQEVVTRVPSGVWGTDDRESHPRTHGHRVSKGLRKPHR